MTAYHGGKQKIGKKLASIITDISQDYNIIGYCEPFCGMLGVYQHIPELLGNIVYKAGDLNKSVILMWKAVQKGWMPPSRNITEDEYYKLRNGKDCKMKGYVGHQYSFGGQYFRGYVSKYGRIVNTSTVIKRLDSISQRIKNVKFSNGPYQQYNNLKNYIIYCDPPYDSTTQNYRSGEFNHKDFYDWCRYMAQNNIVFVSGYKAPNDFKLIYSEKVKLNGMRSPTKFAKSRNRTEKLYML
jgi:DNA adenine methylase